MLEIRSGQEDGFDFALHNLDSDYHDIVALIPHLGEDSDEATNIAYDWARLLASAPELLAACKQAARHFDNLGPVLGESDAAHDERMIRQATRAAIAKAIGGAA